jgi:hypothetical protein
MPLRAREQRSEESPGRADGLDDGVRNHEERQVVHVCLLSAGEQAAQDELQAPGDHPDGSAKWHTSDRDQVEGCPHDFQETDDHAFLSSFP